MFEHLFHLKLKYRATLFCMENFKPKLDVTYNFLFDYWAANGYAPTLHEIAAGLGSSVTSVRQYLTILDALGRIQWTRNKWRSVRLVDVEQRA